MSNFKHEEDGIVAYSLHSAMSQFIDISWGGYYVDFLEDRGLNSGNIYSLKDINIYCDDEYYTITQLLENGHDLKFEVWCEAYGLYCGRATQLEGGL